MMVSSLIKKFYFQKKMGQKQNIQVADQERGVSTPYKLITITAAFSRGNNVIML